MNPYYQILKTLFLKDGASPIIYEIKRNKRKPRTTGKRNIGIGRGSYGRRSEGTEETKYGTY